LWRWQADAVYCAPAKAGSAPGRILRLVTAHSLREIAQARRASADAILLSPVFATRSHPGARTLGPVRFRLLARHAKAPVIALGGMSRCKARRLRWKNWAAIDGV
jgi:thiamine-phosphate pyrophosphorylase